MWVVSRIAAVLILGAMLAGVAACRPREIVPDDVGRILSPQDDSIAYRRMVLANGLKVILVSDSKAERSGAAMSVGVGFFDDPEERAGMAHFLEHMLFLGTKKYPRAGAYKEFMTRYGGYSNAYTTTDHTNYFFQISHEAFEEGLDRFGQFFIAPLFNPEYASREVQAVHSEHSKNIENDRWRTGRVQRMAYREGHPLRKFGTGNLKTLSGVGNEELTAFYERTYSSNLMALTLVGHRSLDELEALVRGRFDLIRNRNLQRRRVDPDYLPKEEALRLLTLAPVKDRRQLLIEFPVPPVLDYFRAKPLALISQILGHEGEGSLLSVLKAENLATTLGSGEGHSTRDYASYNLRIGLTPAGLTAYRRVLTLVLGSIRKLRQQGIPRHIFDEARVMADLNLRFKPRQDSSALASHLSALMQSYPLQSLPDGPYRYAEFAPRVYQRILDALTPDNMLVTLVAKDLPANRIEPYYGAQFSYEKFTGSSYESLRNASADSRWSVPAPNPYIPRHTGVLPPEGGVKLSRRAFQRLVRNGLPEAIKTRLEPLMEGEFPDGAALVGALAEILSKEERGRFQRTILENSLPLPRKLMDGPKGKVWYAQDLLIRQPKAQIVLKLFVADASVSARRVALGELYATSLMESLNETAYPIRLAGLNFGVDWGVSGVDLTIGGYSDRILILLKDLFGQLRQVNIDGDTFASIKERLLRELRSARFNAPYRQSRYFGRLLLRYPSYTREALAAAVSSLELTDVQAFAKEVFRRTYLEGAVIGNLKPEIVRAAIDEAYGALQSEPLPRAEQIRESIRSLPRGADFVFSERLAVNNSFVSFYYDAGLTDPRLRGALLIITRPLRDAFYFNMRTRQQLGYIVYAGMTQLERTLSLIFIVQSGEYGPDTLQQRMDAFLPQFVEQFRALPSKSFEQFRKAVIDAKLNPPKTMAEAAERLFWVAFKHDERFDHVSTDIRAVEALTFAEVKAVLEQVLVDAGRRRLVIRLIGKEHSASPAKGRPVTPRTMARRAS